MIHSTGHHHLTHEGALRLVQAAAAHATAMGQPQCIAVVDASCVLMAFLRLDGARALSEKSCMHKAMTAASSRVPTGAPMAEGHDHRLALATLGRMTNLLGGLPIVVDGQVIGGIGVGSGTGAQDREVGNAALEACGALTFAA